MMAVAETEIMSVERLGDATACLTQIADAINGLTGFTYDPNGNLLTVADAKNQTTTYVYDNMDRLQTRSDALGKRDGVSS